MYIQPLFPLPTATIFLSLLLPVALLLRKLPIIFLVFLQVYSGYRFALAARDKQLPIAILNIGPTRLDHFASLKLNSRCGELLPLIVVHDTTS